MKKFIILIISMICLFSAYIIEESVRLKVNDEAKPLVIFDQTKLCVSCLRPGEEQEIEYYGFGYLVKIRYSVFEKSSNDNKIINVIGKEFLLFNKLRLWAWIS